MKKEKKFKKKVKKKVYLTLAAIRPCQRVDESPEEEPIH